MPKNKNTETVKPASTQPSARLVPSEPGLRSRTASPARVNVSLGWRPDIPDFRDMTLSHASVTEGLKQAKSNVVRRTEISSSQDLRQWCSPIEDQDDLGSCTAQAVVGMMEYMMLRATGEHVDGSRLFLYKVTRRLLGWTGDTGAFLRTTMKAVAAFGVPPEKYYPYDIARYEEEPSAFLYSFAANYKALNYTRLDPPQSTRQNTLDDIRRVLMSGFPIVFGFSTYSSLSRRADIPFPTENDVLQGGHAVMAVGYDDNYKVDGETVPSLLIRNSWGLDWGDDGYGWLPYEYVLQGQANDFWTVFKTEWLETGNFE